MGVSRIFTLMRLIWRSSSVGDDTVLRTSVFLSPPLCTQGYFCEVSTIIHLYGTKLHIIVVWTNEHWTKEFSLDCLFINEVSFVE